MANGKGYLQARELRNIAASEAIAMLQTPPPDDSQDRQRRAMAFTSLVKAWEAACERMRIVRGVPLPGSRRPSAKDTRPKQSRSSGLAPTQPKPEPPQA